MKRLFLVMAGVLAITAFSGCRSVVQERPIVRVAEPVLEQVLLDANGVAIERIPFRPGVSSVTVENLAKVKGCKGGIGAGLMSPPGPVEVYRMICDNGTLFVAKCEFRQCRAIPLSAARS